MDIQKTVAAMSKLDLGLIIAGVIISIGIMIALIIFAFQEWRWLVGIGVPVAIDAAVIAFVVVKIRKAISASAI